MLRILISLAVLSACVYASPLERAAEGQMIVDVPAGVFDAEDSSEAVQVPLSPAASDDDKEDPVPVVDTTKDTDTIIGQRVPTRDPDYDFFNLRVPFPSLFVYRRPVIRDPFSSFGGFQQPQPYQPQQSNNQFNVMNHMEAMMKRMQEQMSSLWGALLNPNYAFRPPTYNNRPIFPSIPESEEKTSVLDFDNLPANYSNSTSETKVIDGQVVQVNKTIHKIASNNSSGFFSFHVIKVQPQATDSPVSSSSGPTEVAHEDTGSAPTEVKEDKVQTSVAPEITATSEKPEDPAMNEIDEQQRQQTENLDQVEKFPFLLNRFKEQYRVDGTDGNNNGGDSVPEKLVKLEEFDIVPLDNQLLERKEIDLSGDIRVNKILEEQNRKAQLKMVNPDVELLIL